MSIEEMNIDFQLKLQEVYSYTFGDFTDEEIDWLLNEHMFKFIEYRTDPKSNIKQEGFESTQKRYDNIENLITSVTLPVIDNGGSVSSFLPSNYFKLVSQEPKVSCETLTTNTVRLSTAYVDLFDKAQTDIVDYKIEFQLSSGTPITVFDKENFTNDTISFKDFNFLRYLIIDKLINYSVQDTFISTDNVGEFSRHNKLVIVGFNKSIEVIITSTDSSDQVFSNTFSPELAVVSGVTPGNITRSVDSRLLEHEFLPRLLNNSFSKTRADSPVVTLENGKIVCYYDDSFFINELDITYIRTPKLLNKRFNVNCELGSRIGQRRNICRQIVDAAVYSAAARLSSGNVVALEKNYLTTE